MATWVGGPDLVPEQLGEPVGELGQELGGGVGLAVPLRVEVGVLEPEVGGQVDDVADLAQQIGHDRLAGAVGQPEEHEVEAGDGGRVVGVKREVGVGGGQARVEVGDGGAGLGVAGGQPHLELGVGRGEPEQLGAGEPRRPDDADLDHPGIMHADA